MKSTNLPTVINVATKTLQKKLLDIMSAIKVARKSIHQSLGSKKNVKVPRVINVPKIGGFLPIVPILTALSALISLASCSVEITINMSYGFFLKPYSKGERIKKRTN